MEHPTSVSGRQRRVNIRHLLSLCLVSTFLAAPSLFTSLPNFAVQASGVEGTDAQHVLFPVLSNSQAIGEQQSEREDGLETDVLPAVDGAAGNGVAARESNSLARAEVHRRPRYRSSSSIRGDGLHPRRSVDRRMGLQHASKIIVFLTLVAALNIGIAAAYYYTQKKDLQRFAAAAEKPAVVEEEPVEEELKPVVTPAIPKPVLSVKEVFDKYKDQFNQLLKVAIISVVVLAAWYPMEFVNFVDRVLQLTPDQRLLIAGGLLAAPLVSFWDLRERKRKQAAARIAEERKMFGELTNVMTRMTNVKQLGAELLGALQLLAAVSDNELESLSAAQLEEYRTAAGMLTMRMRSIARLMGMSKAPSVVKVKGMTGLIRRVADNLAKVAGAEISGTDLILREYEIKNGKIIVPMPTPSEMEELLEFMSTFQYNATGN